MKIATITPSRDRPKLFDNCRQMIDSQTIKPDNRYYICFDPESPKCDLVRRVRQGYELAKKDGIDWIVLFEDDDFYRADHIERYRQHMDGADFIGDPYSYYYRIDNQTWQRFHHHGRASLFTTAFRVSALEKFNWPPDDKVFLDIDLWRYAKNAKLKMKFIDSGALGIKGHGFGKSGGKGHRMKLKNEDIALRFFRSKVNDQQFEFYRKLMNRA